MSPPRRRVQVFSAFYFLEFIWGFWSLFKLRAMLREGSYSSVPSLRDLHYPFPPLLLLQLSPSPLAGNSCLVSGWWSLLKSSAFSLISHVIYTKESFPVAPETLDF